MARLPTPIIPASPAVVDPAVKRWMNDVRNVMLRYATDIERRLSELEARVTALEP